MVEYKNRDRLDREVIGLVLALNSYVGIRTCESCSGHGDHPFWVEFLAHSPESLAEVLWWFRKSLGMSWRVFAKTDVDRGGHHHEYELYIRTNGFVSSWATKAIESVEYSFSVSVPR
jgi:hypothetical protein